MVFQAVAEYRMQVKDRQNFNLEVELAVQGRRYVSYTSKEIICILYVQTGWVITHLLDSNCFLLMTVKSFWGILLHEELGVLFIIHGFYCLSYSFWSMKSSGFDYSDDSRMSAFTQQVDINKEFTVTARGTGVATLSVSVHERLYSQQ